MNINATLIIQAFNFLIAYLLLRFFFLKPAMAIIRQEQAHMDGLIGQVNEKRKLLLALEHQRQEQWRKAQQEFLNRMPQTIFNNTRSVMRNAPENNITFVHHQQINQLETELVQSIVQKVSHAHD